MIYIKVQIRNETNFEQFLIAKEKNLKEKNENNCSFYSSLPRNFSFFQSLKISPFHVLFSLPQAHRIMLGNGGVVRAS